MKNESVKNVLPGIAGDRISRFSRCHSPPNEHLGYGFFQGLNVVRGDRANDEAAIDPSIDGRAE